eukprot:2287388-Pyramimonas_sp.AAC.1
MNCSTQSRHFSDALTIEPTLTGSACPAHAPIQAARRLRRARRGAGKRAGGRSKEAVGTKSPKALSAQRARSPR